MARFSAEDRETIWDMRRGGSARQAYRPSIWTGRTRHCGSSSPITVGLGQPLVSALSSAFLGGARGDLPKDWPPVSRSGLSPPVWERSPSTVCREVNANGGRRRIVVPRGGLFVPSGPSSPCG